MLRARPLAAGLLALLAAFCAAPLEAAIIDLEGPFTPGAAFNLSEAAPFPLHFHANISVFAHMVDQSKHYPPFLRRLEVWYDQPRRRVKTHVHAGFEANKTFLRRYDTKDEYCYRFDEFAECRRAYLSEAMPFPALPAGARYRPGVYTVHERPVFLFTKRIGPDRSKFYVDKETRLPISVTSEYRHNGTWVPMMTWSFDALVLDGTVDADYTIPEPYTHRSCSRHIGGWPYIHIFNHYVRV